MSLPDRHRDQYARKALQARAPQQTLLYRLIARLAGVQLRVRIQGSHAPHRIVMLFVFAEAVIALAIISGAAYLTKLPLLFPPLGPSAFLLFRTPMAAAACPRSVILSHAIGLGAGLLFLQLCAALFPESIATGLIVLNWPRVAAIAFSMGTVSVAMIALSCSHPPAAATALIAAMGYFSTPLQVGGFMAAVGLLVGQASLFHRLIGGLPYPLWKANPITARFYGTLAGIDDENATFWSQLTSRVFQRRSSR